MTTALPPSWMRARSSVSFRQTAHVVLQKLRTVILPRSSSLVTSPTVAPTVGSLNAGAVSPISIESGSPPLQPRKIMAAEQPRIVVNKRFIVILHSTLQLELRTGEH